MGQWNPDMKTINSNKHLLFTLLFLLILITVGFAVRVINLGRPGLGTDESFHVFAAKSMIETGEPELPSGYVYKRALLYTKLVAISYQIFGINEFAARLPSAVFGALTIILVFFVGKTFFGSATGVLSAILFTFSPFAIVWARESRMYTMFQFFYLFGTMAFYKGFENYRAENQVDLNPKKNRPILRDSFFKLDSWGLNLPWLLFSIVLFYISFKLQTLTVLFGASFVAYLILMGILAVYADKSLAKTKNKYFFILLATGITGLVGIIISPNFLEFVKNHLFFAPNWAAGMSFNPLYYLTFLGSKAVFPVGVLFLIGSIQIIVRRHKPGIYLLVCVIIPLLILTFIPSNVRGTRYIYHIFPIIILIAGYSISLIWTNESKLISEWISKRKISRFSYFITGIVVSFLLVAMTAPWINYIYRFAFDSYHEEAQLGTPYRNWKDACKYVSVHRKPEDIIITTEALTASFYGCNDIQYVLTKNPNRQSRFLKDVEDISDLSELKMIISKHQSGWIVIDSSRFNTKRYIKKSIRDFLTKNLPSQIIDPHGTILVFNWNRGSLR